MSQVEDDLTGNVGRLKATLRAAFADDRKIIIIIIIFEYVLRYGQERIEGHEESTDRSAERVRKNRVRSLPEYPRDKKKEPSFIFDSRSVDEIRSPGKSIIPAAGIIIPLAIQSARIPIIKRTRTRYPKISAPKCYRSSLASDYNLSASHNSIFDRDSAQNPQLNDDNVLYNPQLHPPHLR